MNRFTSDQVYQLPRRIVSVKAKAYGDDFTCAFICKAIYEFIYA